MRICKCGEELKPKQNICYDCFVKNTQNPNLNGSLNSMLNYKDRELLNYIISLEERVADLERENRINSEIKNGQYEGY